MFGAHLLMGGKQAVAAISLVGTNISANPLTLPTHSAGDLFVAIRGRTSSTTDTVSSPWAMAFTPFSDADGQPCSFEVAHAVAPTADSLTYPLTLTGRHAYWHFDGAVLGAQVVPNSAQSGTAVTVPALTGLAATSWVIAGFYSRGSQTAADLRLLIPTGYTERQISNGSTNSMIIFDSNGPTGGTTFPGDSATMTTATEGWASFAAEIALAP